MSGAGRWVVSVVAIVAAAALAVSCADDSTSDGGGEGGSATSPTTTATTGPSPLTTAAGGSVTPQGFGTAALLVRRADGTVCELCTFVARTSAERSVGLMAVTDLAGFDGMIFVFEQAGVQTFWMKDTVMPLTAGWFAADGSFVDAFDMAPCPAGADYCPTYGPPDPALHVLEVAQGDLDRFSIGDGSVLVTVGAPCVPDATTPITGS